MNDERKPVLGDTKRPTEPPHMKRWLRDWAAKSDNAPATHTKAPAARKLPNGELDLSDGEGQP